MFNHLISYICNSSKKRITYCIYLAVVAGIPALAQSKNTDNIVRERIDINEGWKFYKYGAADKADDLIYDVRPEVNENIDRIAAVAKPTEALKIEANSPLLKPSILPAGNAFIKDPAKRYSHPPVNPGGDFRSVQNGFDDKKWENISLPCDRAIKGPFYKGDGKNIGGGMGRLPIEREAFNGLCLAIVRAKNGVVGKIKLNVTANSLKNATIKITSKK